MIYIFLHLNIFFSNNVMLISGIYYSYAIFYILESMSIIPQKIISYPVRTNRYCDNKLLILKADIKVKCGVYETKHNEESRIYGSTLIFITLNIDNWK